MSDFGEPWADDGGMILDRYAQLVIATPEVRPRIVACVNYMVGITTEEILAMDAKRRTRLHYGEKSLRFMREAKKAGMRLNEDGAIVLPSGKVCAVKECDGRRRVNIKIDGRSTTVQVARIVCFLTHGEPPSPRCVVDHIDRNPSNDSPENLRWATCKENLRNSDRRRRAFLDEPLAGISDPVAFVERAKAMEVALRQNPHAFARGQLRRLASATPAEIAALAAEWREE